MSDVPTSKTQLGVQAYRWLVVIDNPWNEVAFANNA